MSKHISGFAKFVGLATTVFFSLSSAALAQCPVSPIPISGGGDATLDCHAELASTVMRLNSPGCNPARPKKLKEVACFDGEPGCDMDGIVNNSCSFPVDLCVFNSDPNLPSCTPSTVNEVAVKGNTTKFFGLAGLQSQLDALLPASSLACTSGATVDIALKGPTGKGDFKKAKFTLKAVTAAASGDDKDKIKFVCHPHGWPSHGFDANNTRSTPLDTKITPANVATLQEKWDFAVPQGLTLNPPRAVSSTPTVGPKMVYVSSWNGRVYGIQKKSGKVKWEYDTGSIGQNGIQSSVTIAADGRVVVADSVGKLYCFDGKKGTLLWQNEAAEIDDPASHYWSSPTIAANRVLIGSASHNDAPCVAGTMYSFDLDTGALQWSTSSVPENICYDDTSVSCSVNGDCAGAAAGSPCLTGHCDSNPDVACTQNSDCPSIFLSGGECVFNECWLDRSTACNVDTDCPACVAAVGGGITATAAVSPDAEDVYMASVGCLSFPSVGNSDSIFKLDAATGAVDWVHRTRTIEPFKSFGVNGPSYQDYGFLNGPVLAEVDDGIGGTVAVAIGGSKDGTLYAVDQATGAAVWTNELAPAPTFAAFGLFNGAIAFANGDIYAALYEFTGWPGSNDHLYAFSGLDGGDGAGGGDGTALWSAQIGTSWGDTTVSNGIVWAGNTGTSDFYAYDAATGALLNTLQVSNGIVTGGAAVENGVIYVPYGSIFGGSGGGVIAYELP
jgi:outer membrane protein assembly factor BamB